MPMPAGMKLFFDNTFRKLTLPFADCEKSKKHNGNSCQNQESIDWHFKKNFENVHNIYSSALNGISVV